MASLTAVVVGLIFATAIYLMLSGVLVRFVFGFALASNAVNLLILAAGRLEENRPPLIARGETMLSAPAANALPQALILTAIVIGFAMLAFLLVLLYRAYAITGTLDADDPRLKREEAEKAPNTAAPTAAPLKRDAS